MSLKIPRRQYADLFGPTTGDRVRLADTDLFIEVERDFTTYGDEVKFGGGKVIRDGMGQSARATSEQGALDVVITNAVILDHWGVVKADIGIKDGRIVGIGKAGNPVIMAGVNSSMVIGAATDVIAGEGRLVTAGGIDTHIHFICPQLAETALSAGITTLIGGGSGPATGTNATTCSPGPWAIARMLEAAEGLPLNFGFLGKGNASIPTPQPVLYRPMFGAFGRALSTTSIAFISTAALEARVAERLGLQKKISAVKNCRGITKRSMVHNDAFPRIEVDPETYQVRADGELLTCEAVKILPMAQRYFLF